jgi:hypothetical protein
VWVLGVIAEAELAMPVERHRVALEAHYRVGMKTGWVPGTGIGYGYQNGT